jgi:hypothetical protein
MLEALNGYVASLTPPPRDADALRADLLAHTLVWAEPFAKWGEKWPEQGDPDYHELIALLAALQEDFERVLALHHPALANATEVMLPRAKVGALCDLLADAAFEMIGVDNCHHPPAATTRKRASTWPRAAVKEFPRILVAHISEVQERYAAEPFGPLQEIREFAELKKLVLDFGYRWKLLGSAEDIAYCVHDAYSTYRAVLRDPDGPLPPPDEAMGSRAAVHHLERLTRRLELLIAQCADTEVDDEMSDPEFIREVGRQIRQLAVRVCYFDPAGIPDLSDLFNVRITDRVGRMLVATIERGALGTAEHLQLRVNIEACRDAPQRDRVQDRWPSVAFRSASNYFASRSRLRPQKPADTGSADESEVARAVAIAHGCAVVAEFLDSEADRLAAAARATPAAPTGTVGDGRPGPEREAGERSAAKCAHSDDFTSVIWYGTHYAFTKTQAQCVHHLWLEWEKGEGLSLSEETLAEKVNPHRADHFQISHVFRDHRRDAGRGPRKARMHPAWGAMIHTVGKGVFALRRPGDSPQPPTLR